jgi:hypothetical protein
MMKMRERAVLATACLLIAACGDTPPVSPVSAGVPALPPAHASPDPPPARPIIVEDSGLGAGRGTALDAGAMDTDGGAMDSDAGASGTNGASADGGAGAGTALSAAWQAPITGADAKVAALRPRFRACYTRNIKGRPQGHVTLHATVAADGSIGAVTATDTQGVSGRVVACMIDVMKGAQLPAPGRATTLDAPMSFP